MLRWRRRRIVFCRLLDEVGVGLIRCRIEQAKLLFSPVGGVVLLPNTGLPSLNSVGGFGFGGVLAVFEPFPFFLSSSFFLFSASNALTACAFGKAA
jgi:hypothetical protein